MTRFIAPDRSGSSRAGAGRLARLSDAIRAGQWWEYKFVPILAFFYASARLLDVPLVRLWPAALILLLALAPGAAYVSLINDWTDRAQDAAAAKANRMAGRSGGYAALAIAVPIAAGVAFVWLWRRDLPLLASYLAAWLSFSFYSLPPFRLKARGLAGVVADAAGSSLFPAMVAAILAFRAAAAPLDPVWLGAAAACAFGYGLRGIIWHQLLDAENDRAAAVRTFAQRHGAATVAAVGKRLVFPIELAGLVVMLWKLRDAAPLVALALYAALAARRVPIFRMRLSLVEPGPRHMILLQEYYDFFLPLALLLSSAARHPIDLLAVAVHLLLFPRRALQIARDAWKLRHF